MSYPTNTGQILAWMYPDLSDEVDYIWDGSTLTWNTAAVPEPTDEEITAQEKPYWAFVKRAEIDREQEIRSQTVVGFNMPQPAFALMEELYADILLPAARKAIDETDTPLWWGLKALRDNRNTLLNGLETWVADPAKSADDIRDFDVAGWSGWSVDRP